jgi:hypothetical protein
MSTLTASLLSSLEAIRSETRMMRDAIDEERLDPNDRAVLVRGIAAMNVTADLLLDWLSEQRLEAPKN